MCGIINHCVTARTQPSLVPHGTCIALRARPDFSAVHVGHASSPLLLNLSRRRPFVLLRKRSCCHLQRPIWPLRPILNLYICGDLSFCHTSPLQPKPQKHKRQNNNRRHKSLTKGLQPTTYHRQIPKRVLCFFCRDGVIPVSHMTLQQVYGGENAFGVHARRLGPLIDGSLHGAQRSLQFFYVSFCRSCLLAVLSLCEGQLLTELYISVATFTQH